jgi:DNA polymerase-3 subunit gamma/tau
MSYTALYRKFRPQVFDDVVGQEAIVTTLKNQILANRIGHAYLFCGTRGTGKTSIAKIFARAVNCEKPVDANPCGKCPLCVSIASAASMNVIEIDAASNTGVDNVRVIIDEVTYSPVEGKYKVYIIDEVHMLSTGAFNALLKTLEEPPSYVIFILATTEVHKLPPTILSRCQRYDFRRLSVETIVARLEVLMAEEGLAVEEKALRYIAKSADGAMRDAISLLDQCSAFYFGQKLTYDMVLDVLGVTDIEVFSRLLRACLEGNVSVCIAILEEAVMQGRELSRFVTDFTWYLRNLLLLQTSEGNTEIIDASEENMARLKEESTLAPAEVVMRYIRIFSELTNQIRYAANRRVLIEIALVKLCKPAMETDMQSLLDRVRQLEAGVAGGAVLTSPVNMAPGPVSADVPADIYAHTKENTTEPRTPNEAPSTNKTTVNANKPDFLARVSSPIMRTRLKNAELGKDEGGTWIVVTNDDDDYDYLSGHRPELEEIISEATGEGAVVEIRKASGGGAKKEALPHDLSGIINMEIVVED